VPFGRYKTINYIEDFSHYRPVLKHWQFINQDFEAISLTENDFIYADPPYDKTFGQYAKQGFDWDDQVRLAEWLARHKGPVVLSNEATTRIKQLYHDLGFKLRYLDAPRYISCNVKNRKKVKEVLAIRNL
jgi:DNA adenine methylase